MKRLLIDCSSGISGDMFLGALAALGCDFVPLEKAFRQAGIKVSIAPTPINRAGGPGQLMRIDWPQAQPLRHLSDLTEIVQRLELPTKVRDKSISMLERLAEAEAEAHAAPLEQVHFHEVGAVDTLVDVVGSVWGLELLAVGEIICGFIPWFGGFVDCDHGRLPLPAPATLALLKGKPVYESGAVEELITPTGALLLDGLVNRFIGARQKADGLSRGSGQLAPVGIFEKSGQGYGSREPGASSDWPSRGLRLHLFSLEPEQENAYSYDEVYLLTCHIDHLSGEEIGHAINMLGLAEVLDVLWTPGLTKKNRPSGELQVMCLPEMLPTVQAEIFKHTHTLGLRVTRQSRVTLPRKPAELDSPWGRLAAKEYCLLNQTFVKAEYEALAEAAARMDAGLPALRVQEKK